MLERHLVLDSLDLIFNEYRPYFNWNGQPGVGDAFFRWVHDNRYNEQRCTHVPITPTADESFAEFPSDAALDGFDRADRKFVATSAARNKDPVIAVAVDRGWRQFETELTERGFRLNFLCPTPATGSS